MHEVNYVPDPSSDVPPETICANAMVVTGTGAPTCFVGFNQIYIDLSSGDVYSSESGSWVLVSSGGGGGGGTTELYAADYSGVAPVFTPAGSVAIATDTVTGTQWVYFSGAWH